MINVGVVGFGYWGPNLARNFNTNPNFKLIRIAELKKKRREAARIYFPGIEVVKDGMDIIKAKDVDLVVIATPIFTHFYLAKKALQNGKHVWIEKPMTSTSKEAEELVDVAQSKKLIVNVDHTLLFSTAVQKINEVINMGELGNLLYYDSIRVNLGLFQRDINVIWDLSSHDFSIVDYLIGSSVRGISAIGRDHYNRGLEDIAYVTIYYDNNLLAHFHVNWLSPVKIRRTLIGGRKKMLIWDDLDPEETIRIYNKGVNVRTIEKQHHLLAGYRMGGMFAPKIEKTEALEIEISYLAECLKSGKQPHNNALAGLRIVKMLEATDKSLKSKGKVIKL